MCPAYGTSNAWRSRSQPPPVQRRAARGAQAAGSGPSATASSNPSLPRKAPKQGGPGSFPAQEKPEPVDERTQRLQELDRLAARFAELERDFSPPRSGQLAFQPRATASAPKLEYNSTNAPVHAYEEGLTRLLTELDGVESGGDIEVRSRRKALASRVEGEAQRVETWRRDVFEAKQAGKDGPEWQKAGHGDTAEASQLAFSSSQSVPPVATNSAVATSAEAAKSDAQTDTARPSAEDDEANEPETPVDEVVYHAHEAPASRSGRLDSQRRPKPEDSRSRYPAGTDLPPAVPSAKQSWRDLPMCQAEDGDEEEPWTSADERELRTRSPRTRVPSAPSQQRPRVINDQETSARQRSSQAGSSDARSPEQQRQSPARRAPLDPFEALFGSGSLGGRGGYEQRNRPQRSPPGRREVPSRYATYGDDEDDYDSAAGGDYVLDPRTGSYYPRSRVPWYAHGYPRERELGGNGPGGGGIGGGGVQGGGGPDYTRNAPGRGQRGSGYFTPESDYSYRRGANPFGGFGW